MKLPLLFPLVLAAAFSTIAPASAAAPLRVFIRAGAKTHGPNQHDHPRFLAEWTTLLNERGAKATGAMDFPAAEALAQTDVLVMYCQDGGMIAPEQRANLETYLKRGGGVVVIHDAVCGSEAAWFKTIVGGAWQHGRAKFFEGDISLYYVNQEHPITAGASNFDFDDELYYDLDFEPGAQVLASTWTPDQRAQKTGRAFPHIYNTAPQLWTYERKIEGAAEPYRAFVSIPGHNWKTFEVPNFRAVLLRGIAWAGKRPNVDELCAKEELASLRYPPGGPTRPQEAVAKINLQPDFKISLVASEPLINKPINIDWDAAGRMWLVETPEYPNGRRGLRPDYAGQEWKDHGGIDQTPGQQNRPAHDKIVWLEDSDGDGAADRKHVFYEGLELATGFVFHKDGVIVTQAPDILWLRDTNGDGTADKVEKLYTGLGTGDTHAVINNPRWGFDGWIYATHGYSASRDVTGGDGAKHFGAIGSGVVRFKPDGSAMEQFSSKGGNTWGLTITWDNEVMWTQPTSGDLLMHTVLSEEQLGRGKVQNTPGFKVVIRSPKAFPAMTWDQQAYRQIDLVGSFTAAAGAALYDGGTWPAEYNGDYFCTEPTINIVHQERLKADGVSFAGSKLPGFAEAEFMTSKDLWFRPIETRVGTDGALYVVDFYNQAVIHNDTRGPHHNGVNAAVRPDRDHYFGRIWRVDHKSARPNPALDLAKASAPALVAALESQNKAVRFSAHRLLVESAAGSNLLQRVATDVAKPAFARIHALWVLHLQGQLDGTTLYGAVADKDPSVSRNALRLVAAGAPVQNIGAALTAKLADPDPRTRLAAILALGGGAPDAATISALLAAWPSLNDPWLQSAALAAANGAPEQFLIAALSLPDAEPLKPLLAPLAAKVRETPENAARVVIALAAKTGSEIAMTAILSTLAEGADKRLAPAWSGELQTALAKLLESNSSAAVLPLAAAWDKQGALTTQVRALAGKLLATLNDATAPDDKRGAAIATLLALKADVKPAIAALLVSPASIGLRLRALHELGETTDAEAGAVMAKSFAQLEPSLQSAALTQLLKRPQWTRGLIREIENSSVPITALGPIGLDRLRNYPDKAVAKEAAAAILKMMGPQIAQKDKLIASLLPQIETGGDIPKGKTLFTGTCAICHKFNNEGSPLAPDLTGMGAHPRAELLTHIVDPNREVDPTYAAWTVELKDGNSYVGVITRENAQSVTIRDQAAEHDVPKAQIKTQAALGRSLMPEGFEALGGATLRDIIAYIASAESKYQLIDLRAGFTADSRQGIFNAPEAVKETVQFKRFGDVKAGEVPFRVADPAQIGSGLNLLELKGGAGYAKTLPQRVEVAVNNVRAAALHFLGGVAGWGYPCCGENKDLPVLKVTVLYEGGAKEEMVFKNGVEFADYIGAFDVPGSTAVNGLVKAGQIRTFRKPLAKGGTITKLIFESFDNSVAPVVVAVTAEAGNLASAPAAGALARPAALPGASAPGDMGTVRALAVGGGSSHDFKKWFGEADKATLLETNPAWIDYIENPSFIAEGARSLDVLVLSTNQPLSDEARKEIMEMATSGKGLVLYHPALWYNWDNFPEYNRVLVGGGARGHDAYGEFEVEVLDTDHPLTAGLPKKFKITDELYHFTPDAQGTPIKVLAQATSPITGKTFPQIWVTQHPTARIACITLGHDGKARESAEFRTLLKNAFRWAAKK